MSPQARVGPPIKVQKKNLLVDSLQALGYSRILVRELVWMKNAKVKKFQLWPEVR